MTDATEKYADKIAKLLRKAESTSGPEAELLVAKAQELMTQYSITEELIRKATGDNRKTEEPIVRKTINLTGIFKEALMDVAYAIVKANDCRGVYYKQAARKGWTQPNGEKVPARPATIALEVIGHESDVNTVTMLNASLQIQAASAQLAWWKTRKADIEWMSGMEKFKERREFLYGFASGLRFQLNEAKRKGQEAARAAEADRVKAAGATAEDAKTESTASVALVIRSKAERVDDYMDKSYGRLRSRSSSRSTGSGNASSAGHSAGRSADASTGSGRVGNGGRKSIGR